MYDMIHRDHVISAITWLNEHNSHDADIKLNEHWYNDIAAKEMSIQLDKIIIISQLLVHWYNDIAAKEMSIQLDKIIIISVTEDAVLHQPLQMENTNKDKLNKEDNQQLCTKHTESINIETIDTECDGKDTELLEEQVAVNCRQ